jgi:ParB family chromosome partitioning protein
MDGEFILDFDITNIKPAEYNPRKISDESLNLLKNSVTTLGIVKPVIVRKETIIAGHQRVKALLDIGIKNAPVYLLAENVNTYDEMMFNQLHNGADMDTGDEEVVVKPSDKLGYVDSEVISGNKKASGAQIRQEISKMMLKYGAWGACVATQSGKVIHAAQYALCCYILNYPCRVYYIEDSKQDLYLSFLSKSYGEFNYDHIKRDPFVQTYAQPLRLSRDPKSVKENRAPTYEKKIIPWLKENPELRYLDFGCGRGDYIRELKKAGFKACGLEFFVKKGGKALNIEATHLMVDDLLHYLKTNGKFDIVMADYVLNSVVSKEAESDVMNCINIFCKMGGKVLFSGHRVAEVERKKLGKVCINKKRYPRAIEFLDKENFSGSIKKGHWFFQMSHTDDQPKKLAEDHGLELIEYKKEGMMWYLEAKKIKEIPENEARLSIEREFNMPYNTEGTITLNRHKEVIDAIFR